MAQVREVMGDAPVYITFDIDAVDPGYAPGTGLYHSMKIRFFSDSVTLDWERVKPGNGTSINFGCDGPFDYRFCTKN